jgi:phosphoribosylanthranilate isomerase
VSIVQVKICGLTRPEDVRCVAECGADLAGFILYEKSKRYVSPARIRELVRLLPAATTKVGVVVNASVEFAREALEVGGLDLIQFCGDESADVVAAVPRAWRAVGLVDEEAVRLAVGLPGEAVLVDSIGDGAHGGTGRRCNWRLAGLLAAQRSVVLAGGLHPDNVAEAVRQVRPFAVDVASGVESAPGIKNHAKIRAFVHNARKA